MQLTPQQIENLRTKLSLSLTQTAQLKNELSKFSEQADAAVDNWLVKIGKSKWTWAIVLGIVAAAWAFGFIQG